MGSNISEGLQQQQCSKGGIYETLSNPYSFDDYVLALGIKEDPHPSALKIALQESDFLKVLSLSLSLSYYQLRFKYFILIEEV